MIDFDIIKIRFNIFMCSILGTYFLVFMKEDFINCNVNNSIILLLNVRFLSFYGIVTVVLIMPTFIMIITKVFQDLAFI